MLAAVNGIYAKYGCGILEYAVAHRVMAARRGVGVSYGASVTLLACHFIVRNDVARGDFEWDEFVLDLGNPKL